MTDSLPENTVPNLLDSIDVAVVLGMQVPIRVGMTAWVATIYLPGPERSIPFPYRPSREAAFTDVWNWIADTWNEHDLTEEEITFSQLEKIGVEEAVVVFFHAVGLLYTVEEVKVISPYRYRDTPVYREMNEQEWEEE